MKTKVVVMYEVDVPDAAQLASGDFIAKGYLAAQREEGYTLEQVGATGFMKLPVVRIAAVKASTRKRK